MTDFNPHYDMPLCSKFFRSAIVVKVVPPKRGGRQKRNGANSDRKNASTMPVAVQPHSAMKFKWL